MNAPDRKVVSGVFDAIDLGLILLDGDRRVIGWNAWIENASGISGRRRQGPSPGRAVSRQDSAATGDGDLAGTGAGRFQSGHAHASPGHPAVAHPSRPPAGTQHLRPPERQTARPALPAADPRRHRRGGARAHPARASERALRRRRRQRARHDPDPRCRRHDPARQPGGGAAVRLFTGRAHRPSAVVLPGRTRHEWSTAFKAVRDGEALQPPHRAHGAAQERLAQLSRGVGIEMDERRQNLRHRDPA